MKNPAWSLVQYVGANDADRVCLGIAIGDTITAGPSEFAKLTMMSLIQDWPTWTDRLHNLQPTDYQEVAGARAVAPLTYPNKILCSGANYYSHAREMGTARPDPSAEPFFFLKPPTTTITGPTGAITLPSSDAKVDWEAELGFVIGDRCKDVDPTDAMAHVAGFVVANDLSARGWFTRNDAVSPPFSWDWLAHKGLDGFCPIGPGLVPAWLVPDWRNLGIRLYVNGQLKQDSNTSDMVIGIERLLSGASRLVTLEPGDVILTGTPAGVGVPRNEFLKGGDIVVVEIEGIGRLENRMIAHDRLDEPTVVSLNE